MAIDIWNLDHSSPSHTKATEPEPAAPREDRTQCHVQPNPNLFPTTEPYLANNDTELIIPPGCSDKYKWWMPGSYTVFEILIDLEAPLDTIKNYVDPIQTPDAWEQYCELRNLPKGPF